MSTHQNPGPPVPATQPGTLLIHLLNRCNLLCQHCYVNATTRSKIVLPLDLVLNGLEQAENIGFGTVILSGGEPFMYPHLPEILAYFIHKPHLTLRVASNGTLIRAKEAALLRESRAKLQVSIDGPEEFHDQFRGVAGSYRRALRGVRFAVSAGVPVTIVITLTRDNIDCLPWLAELAAEMGVGHISAQPLLSLGRGADIRDKKLTEKQLENLFLQLSDLGYTYQARGLRFSLASRTRRFLLAHPCAAYVCNGVGCHRKVAKEIAGITGLPFRTAPNKLTKVRNFRRMSTANVIFR